MPKFLIHASYTSQGVKGLADQGGSKRKQAAEGLVKELGGRLESFYFTFGESDAIAIVDVPDNASAAAAAMIVNATGAVQTRTTVLLTPEELDEAANKHAPYSPPGR